MGSTSSESIDLTKVNIEPLDSKMSRAAFSCGNARIDNFFRTNSRDQHTKNKVRVYVADYQSAPVGYYYLVATSNLPEMVSEQALEKFGRVKSVPCIYLGMIGVDCRYQGVGLGKILMLHAMKTTLKVADLVGLYALTLDAIDEATAQRYERWGFQRFQDGGLAMYVPLPTIRELFSPKK